MSKITLVTGLWNLGRDKLTEGWSRSFESYLEKFNRLLDADVNFIIFGDSELEQFIYNKRNQNNTQFVHRPLEWFVNNEFFSDIQKIRSQETWYNQCGWLSESTQAKLEMYNPVVMSKMFLLHDAKILDKFDSDFLFWIDAGLASTVHPGYFSHDKVVEKLPKFVSKFSFVCFPYDADKEIHGFDYNKMKSITNCEVKKVARGGFFGGPKNSISEINSIYYSLMRSTLAEGYMGTEESLFSIICYNHPELVDHFEINGDGLLSKFFEDLKNESLQAKTSTIKKNFGDLDISKTSLYVIGFNSPSQLQTLIQSMLDYDSDFITKPKKYLLDNSTDESTFSQYVDICEKFGFEHIKKDNLGICGGRQWIAEHFEESDSDFMFFFEDDMFFYNGKEPVCRHGFVRVIKNLYLKSLEICNKENFDFLKLNYSEFFGDNGTQWAWYNVPQVVREKFWPNNSKLPQQGLDPNAPKAQYDKIVSHKGVPYTNGEVYYCNWPQIVSKKGNKKMFLDTKWAHPFEQTWMSHMFQLTKKDELSCGLLLATPTEHNRFEHYDGKLRKES